MRMFEDKEPVLTHTDMEYEYQKNRADSAENKLENAQKMLMNICQNVYKLKANWITVDQLLAIVNGCLDEKVIDRFTWNYLTDTATKEKEIDKSIKMIQENFIEDAKEEYILADDIDLDESGAEKIVERRAFKPNSDQEYKGTKSDAELIDNGLEKYENEEVKMIKALISQEVAENQLQRYKQEQKEFKDKLSELLNQVLELIKNRCE